MTVTNSAPQVLVGGTYLDVSSGLFVRVLDSRRSSAQPAGQFIVESATRSRPGERWVCEEKDLQDPRDAPPSLDGTRRAALLRTAKEALLCTEQVLGGREALPVGSNLARVAARLRSVADELASFTCPGRIGVDGGSR